MSRKLTGSILEFPPLELPRIASEAETEAVTLPVLHVTFLRAPTPVIPLGPHGSALAATYERLVDWVSEEALAGDRDAAELIIVCSVAKVYVYPPVSALVPQLSLANRGTLLFCLSLCNSRASPLRRVRCLPPRSIMSCPNCFRYFRPCNSP